ncbi:hypothetical protein CAI21_14855 [Alkalilimnicola ehrlichii]|uniref:Uncharacterized protein n=1 Tax=Alkalilimnicola ehrlichii TaxID=351052 RepID=A0A3E0WN81_9GAMM|nr:hypothetical protein [Alkalilimnicola ehrlichii]RFA27314.1 hypothetical protein CAI21_14855 [Alkalilimnicola ehrlichii]RFA34422.1 hypothetical protein CAL65_15425 [Alkalilimnicola ehrlichii]
MPDIELTTEESVYLAYRDGGGESILPGHCAELGISLEEGKEMIRRQYKIREESGNLKPYDKRI